MKLANYVTVSLDLLIRCIAYFGVYNMGPYKRSYKQFCYWQIRREPCRFHRRHIGFIFSCMGMTIDEAKMLEQFLCSDCASDEDARRSNSYPVPATSTEVQVSTEGVHTGTAKSYCWSPDGSLLAIASYDSTISIWEKIGNDIRYASSLKSFADLWVDFLLKETEERERFSQR